MKNLLTKTLLISFLLSVAIPSGVQANKTMAAAIFATGAYAYKFWPPALQEEAIVLLERDKEAKLVAGEKRAVREAQQKIVDVKDQLLLKNKAMPVNLDPKITICTICNKNFNNSKGCLTPLICAAYNGNLEQVKLLLKNNADVNQKDDYDRSALIRASEWPSSSNHSNIVKELLKNNAHVDQQNKCGWTALMKAVQFSCPDIVNMLLKNNANTNLKNGRGGTAFTLMEDSKRFGYKIHRASADKVCSHLMSHLMSHRMKNAFIYVVI